MKVYIAGKVTGLDYGDVFVKFYSAEYRLQKMGFQVINPIKLCSKRWSWIRCMITCISALAKCNAICPLPDWRDSRGARIEMCVARLLNLIVISYDKI